MSKEDQADILGQASPVLAADENIRSVGDKITGLIFGGRHPQPWHIALAVSAMLGMLTSCASGVAVVNIDNGFGGGFLAARIARMAHRGA